GLRLHQLEVIQLAHARMMAAVRTRGTGRHPAPTHGTMAAVSGLKDFERRLEGAVQGAFAKTFRSGLQPVELAKKILREMDGGRTVGVDGSTWAPNRFVFTLGPEDHARFGSAETQIANELGQVVLDGAREHRWGLVGPPTISFAEDAGLK